MKTGVLRKGFTIVTPVLRFTIPRGTIVHFHNSPAITFEGVPGVRLFRISNKWFADLYGTIHMVLFDRNNPPYPISFFK